MIVDKFCEDRLLTLEERAAYNFLEFWERIKGDGKQKEIFKTIVDSYSETHRAYHTLKHIVDCIKEFQDMPYISEHPNEIEMALWFHDIIYDTRAKDNEEKSAKLAYDVAERMVMPEFFNKRVYDLILTTKHREIPNDTDSQVLVDIDLSILGKPKKEFNDYELNIRKEYLWVPEEQYKLGRSTILKNFLERTRIYSTDYFYKKYENKARENIQGSLNALK